jgi:hypothetical protein
MAELASIEEQIKQDRRGLAQNVRELENRARAMADWRTHYANHTLAALTTAALGGAVLGSLLRRGPTHSGRAALSVLDPAGRTSQQVRGLIDHTVDALLGVGSAMLVDTIADFVPQFKQEFQRASRT